MSRARPCLLIVGAGYSGAVIAERAAALDFEVIGTRTSESGLVQLASRGIDGLILEANQRPSIPDEASARAELSSQLQAVLERMTHLMICVSPSREAPFYDPVHRELAPFLERGCRRWQWMAYLSTIGVYGDHQGQWIDEAAPCVSEQIRSVMRREAEMAWQATALSREVPASILRLSGIYGPGRNMVEDALAGRGRRLVKKGQVFNRIHVDDIATAALAAAEVLHDGVLNITDNEPAPSHVVVEFAHQLVGRDPPPVTDYETAELSAMARSFYSENKRASNARSRERLGMEYQYPTYREGLAAEALRLSATER